MCPGPTGLQDMKIINDKEKQDYDLKHKSLTKEQIEQIIKDNKYPDEGWKKYVRVSKSATLRYNIINASKPTDEQLEEIHEFIEDYFSISKDDDLRLILWQKLREKSLKLNLYKDDSFWKLMGIICQLLLLRSAQICSSVNQP